MKPEFEHSTNLARILAIVLLAILSASSLVDSGKAEENPGMDDQTLLDPAYEAGDYLNRGVKAFANQQYSDAAEYFEKSMELDPEMEEPRMYLATTYMLQFVPGSTDPGNIQMAENAIKTFMGIVDRAEGKGNPNVNAMLAIASISYQMNNMEQTKEWCNRVLQVEAKTDDIDKSKAEAHYRIAVTLFDNVHERTGVLGEKVENMEHEGKLQILSTIEEGLSHLEEAIKIRPDYYDAMMYENLLWRELGKLVDDETYKQEVIRRADTAYAKAVELKLKAEIEAAAKRKQIGSER